tara:strand:+ start:104 stop:1939 length:1836 start_codon:yes stop_codon:yes gene_type:complete
MFIAILTLLSALSISGVAIFYSVIGLATIFPGAFWPVVIMGSVLEVGKLVTASWLYRNWKHTRFLLKSYLTIAVIVLSLITSMGIFGFLSKAHLEQNLAENTVNQRIEIINNKINSQETYIERQQLVIERAEKSLANTGKSNTDAIGIEQSSLKAIEDKFKTLLAVETNTIKDLNARMNVLDKDVSDVLTANKQFFNEEKAAKELKESQKEERAMINKQIIDAQNRIALLKEDYSKDTAIIQTRIDKLRAGDVDDKSDVYAQIKLAEANILTAQNTIDDLVVEREPLESKMIKLEAEVGPVKYIAALAVDWGVTNEVNTSEAVRWIILVIICVFDPLAVLLLVAANQSLLRRFPVTPPKPQEVIDLEKPDEEDITLKWNETMAKQANKKMSKATEQLKDWQDKLNEFNSKVEKPKSDHVEIVQEDKNDSEKKEEKDGFDLDEVAIDMQTETVPPKLFDQPETATVEEALKMPENESVETPIEERIKPDLTEVIEPENVRKVAVADMDELAPEAEVGEFQSGYKPKAVKKSQQRILTDAYVQNEEQSDKTLWQKSQKRLTTEDEYHTKLNARIEKLMAQLDAGEIDLNDLTAEDRQVIIEIRMQNESGDNLK